MIVPVVDCSLLFLLSESDVRVLVQTTSVPQILFTFRISSSHKIIDEKLFHYSEEVRLTNMKSLGHKSKTKKREKKFI